MKNINLVTFKTKISEFLDEVFFHNERYVVMKNGKKRAVVMSHDEYEKLIEYIREADGKREVK